MHLHLPSSEMFYWTSIERLRMFRCTRAVVYPPDFNFEQVVRVMALVINSVCLAAQVVRSPSTRRSCRAYSLFVQGWLAT